jgi:serine/threonine protein kinase
MSPEALRDGYFTTSSDIWSYGVVLWEMINFGAQPYPGMANHEVVEFVKCGNIMREPVECPQLM